MTEENPTPQDQPQGTPENTSGHNSPSTPQSLGAHQFSQVGPIASAVEKIRSEVSRVIIGQGDHVELLLTGLLSGGHVLIEGLPGIAKTLLAKTVARTLNLSFNRIQFTPDLMPTDITGTAIFDNKSSEFRFRKGPVFGNIILIDEINRAPAKTQAALMEVMEEKQITYDGQTYPMAFPFLVIATQNPIEQEGTYALPEAQLDRFMFRLKIGYPTPEQEQAILERFASDFQNRQFATVNPVADGPLLQSFIPLIEKVHIRPELVKYIADIVCLTRQTGDLFLGASPRASLTILKSSKTLAAIRGRDFVTPDDIRTVCYPVLNHRLILSHEREMEGTTTEDIIASVIEQIEVPR
jgi:MoxR-like ATPase